LQELGASYAFCIFCTLCIHKSDWAPRYAPLDLRAPGNAQMRASMVSISPTTQGHSYTAPLTGPGTKTFNAALRHACRGHLGNKAQRALRPLAHDRDTWDPVEAGSLFLIPCIRPRQ
jgi:hypothetical protein